jgi:chromate reductase
MSVKVLGFAGSLRRASYNRALLRAAVELAPAGMAIETFELQPLPLYDGDLDVAGGPEPVRAFKDAIRGSDALLIACPEYNYGVPGVLKNAIDWASRPAADGARVLEGKAAAIIGASPGMGGTMRAQLQLRQAFVFTETYPLMQPEFVLPRCQEKFDADGRLTDAASRKRLSEVLVALAAWAERLRGLA